MDNAGGVILEFFFSGISELTRCVTLHYAVVHIVVFDQNKIIWRYPAQLRGVAGRDSGEFYFLLKFELLTFPCREMIKLSIHIWHISKMNLFIYRKRIFFGDACIVYIEKAKLQMRFLHYAFFS